MTISAKNHIVTAFSTDDAELINPVINEALAENDDITIDFTDITFFTTLFFSSAVTRFVYELGPENYDRIFNITGLTEIGQAAYSHSLEFAREEYLLTPEQKQARLAALDNESDEE